MLYTRHFFTLGLFAMLAALAITLSPAPSPVHAANFTAVASGDWFDAATWGGSIPSSTDNVTIPAGIDIVANAPLERAAGTTTTIESGASLTALSYYSAYGTTINNGIFFTNDRIYLYGTFINTGEVIVDEDFTIYGPSGTLNNFGSINTIEVLDNYNVIFNDGLITIGWDFANDGAVTNLGTINVGDGYFNEGSTDNRGQFNIGYDLYNHSGLFSNSCGGVVTYGGDLEGDVPAEVACVTSFVPNLGEVFIFYSAPTPLYNAVGGQATGLSLPHDADGNGYDAMQVTGLRVDADGTIWLSVWLGTPTFGWIVYDADTMQITSGVYQAIYNAQ